MKQRAALQQAKPVTRAGDLKRISILGSTGSVGTSTLDLVTHASDRDGLGFKVAALTANENVELLARQAIEHDAEFVAVADESRHGDLKALLSGTGIRCGAGEDAVIEAASIDAECVMAAIVGAAGLNPTLQAAKRGADIALANKECLVCAGAILLAAVEEGGGRLLPVDSEHNAIFQVYDFQRPERVTRLLLTASGGPFRTWDLEQMRNVTVEQAVTHPNWSMGAKISVDSATMMNKGLELIEAAHLFPGSADVIEVLVHPQSIIHSMVEYVDGSVLAQLGTPDMRTPIASALAWPDRLHSPSDKLDFSQLCELTFEVPDEIRFPCLRLAREALEAHSLAPTVLNAANEIAVAAFLKGHLNFLDIAAVNEQVLADFDYPASSENLSLELVLGIDDRARKFATECINKRAN